ncbi:putative oxidoreductase [Klebsiella pneumoniae IS53]|nr:putative oxidoreductase [Klebsiella pneumoniae IS53]
MGFGNPSTGQHRWTLDETASRDIIRHALEQGINFYDTAIAYQNGSSERYVGRALREMAKTRGGGAGHQVSATNRRADCRGDQRKTGYNPLA